MSSTDARPFAFVHVDVAKLATTALPPAPAALYFWCGDQAVGHLWLDRADQCSDMVEAARQCVDRAALECAQRGGAERPGANSLTTTVVICTRNRPIDLRRCVAALHWQTRQADQIIVVDNAPQTDAVQVLAREMGVDYVLESTPGLDVARNAGVRAATGDIVLFTDDDVEVQPKWLAHMVAAFDDQRIGCVTGLVLPTELTTEAQRYFERFWGFGRGYSQIDFANAFFASDVLRGCPAWDIGAGASMALRRDAFCDVGYFDERLDAGAAGCSGDSEFWHRLLSHCWTCRYEPRAIAFHYHRREIAELRKQIRSYMRGHTVALMIQFERTRHVGNLVRAFLKLPLYLGLRLARRAIAGPNERDRLLHQEIAGYFSGLWFYARTPRSAGRVELYLGQPDTTGTAES